MPVLSGFSSTKVIDRFGEYRDATVICPTSFTAAPGFAPAFVFGDRRRL
jgi:hypothetical protein